MAFGSGGFGALYFGQIDPEGTLPVGPPLEVEIAKVRSLNPVRTVGGTIDHVVRSLKNVRTVEGIP